MPTLTLHHIVEARERIRPYVHRTPVMRSASLDALTGASLFFKCENFQRTGAFKARGAHNAVFSLSDAEAARGVVTHSSGNHGAALALAARNRGIPAYVVVPRTAAAVKKAAVARLGAAVTLCEPTLEAREEAARRIVAETGATLVHPYDDLRVIAGQGTSVLELLEDVPDLDAVMCPVGGGGQLAGVAVAAKGLAPAIRVYGAEPAMADDARRSLQAGRIVPAGDPRTIADGLRSSLGELGFALIRALVEDILTAGEPRIIEAMRLAFERLKIVIEPSAAVPLAALLELASASPPASPPASPLPQASPLPRGSPLAGLRIGVIVSGGNVDLDRLPWMSG